MKRALWIVVFSAALIAAGLGVGRWQVERPNRTVEIIYDLPGLLELEAAARIPMEGLLADLRRAGVDSVAVQPESVGERFLLAKPLPPSVAQKMPADPDKLGRLLALPAAFRPQDFALLEDNGFKAAPKLNVVTWDVEPVWAAANPPELLILSGRGEFSRAELQDFTGRLALVEFHAPGTAQMEDAVGRMVRLHGISAGEMEVLPAERILTRYLRAVRERNIRVLYVRPFVEGGERAWARSLDLLARLQQRLEDEAILWDRPSPSPRGRRPYSGLFWSAREFGPRLFYTGKKFFRGGRPARWWRWVFFGLAAHGRLSLATARFGATRRRSFGRGYLSLFSFTLRGGAQPIAAGGLLAGRGYFFVRGGTAYCGHLNRN